MRRRLSGVLAGLLCAVWAGAAVADDNANFELLRQVCIATHASRMGSLASGEAAGFVLPPPNGVAMLLVNLQFEASDVKSKLTGDKVATLIVGKKSTTLDGQPVIENLCAIATAAPDADADAALEAWIGVPPASNHGGNPFFVFTGPSGAHQSAAALTEADAVAAIHRGDMQTAAIVHQADTTVFVYGVFVP